MTKSGAVKKLLITISLSLLFAAGITAVLHYSSRRLLERLENVAYDWRYRLKYQEGAEGAGEEFPDYGIHIVDIDERSMEKMGSYWSWDRGYQAKMVEALSSRFPAAIAFDVLFYEPEDAKRYARLAQALGNAVGGDSVLRKHAGALNERLAASVDYDIQFARAIKKSGRVTLGLSMADESNYRDFASQVAHRMDMEWHNSLHPASTLTLPDSLLSRIRSTKTIIDGIYPENAKAAKRIGHVNVVDASSVVRAMPLLYRFAKFQPVYLPVSIRVAADLFATPNDEIAFKPDEYIDIGKPFKIFKDKDGRAAFSYPDFTEAQYRIIAADREEIPALEEGKKRRVSSYIAVFRDDSGGVGIETRGGKASGKMLAALASALMRNAKSGAVDADGINTGKAGSINTDKASGINTENVSGINTDKASSINANKVSINTDKAGSINTDKVSINTDKANGINTGKANINPNDMAVDDELDISGGFIIRRDSDVEWEVFSDDESLWLTALDVRTLSSFAPGDLDLPPGVDRKLVTFDFWVKRENGILVSPLPVLRTPALNELLALGDADAVLGSIPPGSRRDFGAPARIPLRDGNFHVVTYFGPKSKPFPYFSFCDVMENKVNYPMEGNVFIVGSTSPAMFDIKSAPHERVFPAVEIHASLLNAIFTGVYVRRLTEWQDILVMAAVGLAAALIAFLTKPFLGGALAGASLFAYSFAAFHLFDTKLLWVEMVRPLITIALTFTAVMVYRYMTEEKNRKFLQSTFKQYLSPELIDMMYTQKQRPQLGGDEGVRTAYFTDIEGFSTFSEKLGSPTRLVELLNEYLSAMTDILLGRYGTLDKYEGDAIIAFFGAPVPMPDHAAQACHTALDMQGSLENLRGKWRSEGGKWPAIVHNMRMRIGINTGAITTGNMGSAVRMNYTMMGDAVNLAARLESAAKYYGVYTMISNYTRDMVGNLFDTRKLDVITVVGKSEPVTVYELICRKGEMTSDAATLLEAYNQGINNYYDKRDWNKALGCFVKANEFEPNRKVNPEKPTPSKRFIDMCKSYIDNPPGDDWDGVNRLTSK